MKSERRVYCGSTQVGHLNANALFTYIYMQMSFSCDERGRPGTRAPVSCVDDERDVARESFSSAAYAVRREKAVGTRELSKDN